jgi:hypothetical protein
MPPRTSLSHCLSLLTQVVPEDLPTLTQDLPGELIQQALAATGTATVRRRRLVALVRDSRARCAVPSPSRWDTNTPAAFCSAAPCRAGEKTATVSLATARR